MSSFLTYTFQAVSLFIFISLVPILLFVDAGTSLVWTLIIPFVPIFIIAIGYSNWRKICPLAFFSKVSQKINITQKRKVPKWFEKNLYVFQFTILLLAFSARLVLLNFDTLSLAIFFIFVILAAFVTNLIYTGKTWCNFFCPVGIVEKIYCGSNANNSDNNSSCSTCTSCKKNCPDIDMENNYWKEKDNPQQSFAFYSFSGLILGFYIYFYLQTGSYSYYFDGSWSSEDYSIFSQGFFFAPYIPLILAAPITLLLFSIISYYIFKSIENYLWEHKTFPKVNYETLRHRVRIVSAFVAFNIFYAFAGAPTFNDYPLFYSFFHFFVVALSALILHKEFYRTDSGYVVERFTIKMIKKLNPNKKQTYKDQLAIYKQSLYELFESGILDHDDVAILEELRNKVGISHADHYNVIREIKLQNKKLFDNNVIQSPERKYQINSYRSMIEDALEKHQQLDESIIESIQKQFCISNKDHKDIMDKLINSNKRLKSEVLDLINNMKSLISTHNSIYNDSSMEINFLKYSIRKEFNRYSRDLFILLDIIYEDFHKNINLFKKLLRYHEFDESIVCNDDTLEFMDKEISSATLELIKELNRKDYKVYADNNIEILNALTKHKSITLSTVALLCMKNYPNNSTNINFNRFLNSDNDEIVAVANKILYGNDNLTIFDKMIYIHHVPIFSTIKFDDLYHLSKSINSVNFKSNEDIITQGEDGNSLYILTSGKVDVLVDGISTNTLDVGDHFGAVAIIADTKRTATIRTLTNCSVLMLSEHDFKSIIYENPKISFKIMKEITNKLLNNSKLHKN